VDVVITDVAVSDAKADLRPKLSSCC